MKVYLQSIKSYNRLKFFVTNNNIDVDHIQFIVHLN